MECSCPRCGYEHTASEVSERISAAKTEEAKKKIPKIAVPKSASWHKPSPLMRVRGGASPPLAPAARRPASPYVDPFSGISGRVEKGSSAKAVILYGVTVILGVAILAILAVRISQFVFSSRMSTGSSVVKPDPKPGMKKPFQPAPPAPKPPLSTTPQPGQVLPPQGKPVLKWERPKHWYESECTNAEKIVEKFQFGGYKITGGSVSARSVKRRIAELRNCVVRDDPRGAEAVHEQLVNDVKEYSAHCVWTKGLRHPKYAHILSGQNDGEWVVEEGYMLVHPGTTDWTVKKVPVAVVCRKCNGSRCQMVSVRCPVCHGRKVLATRGRVQQHRWPVHRRGPGLIPPPVMSVQCYQCRGVGSVQQSRQCQRCRGTGTEFKR